MLIWLKEEWRQAAQSKLECGLCIAEQAGAQHALCSVSIDRTAKECMGLRQGSVWPKARADILKANIKETAEMAQLFKESTALLEPKFTSSHPCPSAHNSLYLQLQWDQKPLASIRTVLGCMYPHRGK